MGLGRLRARCLRPAVPGGRWWRDVRGDPVMWSGRASRGAQPVEVVYGGVEPLLELMMGRGVVRVGSRASSSGSSSSGTPECWREGGWCASR